MLRELPLLEQARRASRKAYLGLVRPVHWYASLDNESLHKAGAREARDGCDVFQPVDDPGDELTLFFAQFRNVYHLTFPFASTANAAPLGIKAAQEAV